MPEIYKTTIVQSQMRVQLCPASSRAGPEEVEQEGMNEREDELHAQGGHAIVVILCRFLYT